MVGEVVDTEPEWDDRSRTEMLALAQERDETCSGCGQPLGESLNPDNEERYVAGLPSRCHACTPLYSRMESYQGGKAPQPQALRFGVEKR